MSDMVITFKHYEMIMAIRPITTHYHTKSLSHYWPCSLCVHYTLMTYWIYSWRFVPLTTLLLKYFLACLSQSRVQSLGHIAISVCVGGEGGCSVMSESFWRPWIVVRQAPLSVGFSRQEYWSGLLFPPPGDLPNPGIKPKSPSSSALIVGFFTTEPLGKPIAIHSLHKLLKKKKNVFLINILLLLARPQRIDAFELWCWRRL